MQGDHFKKIAFEYEAKKDINHAKQFYNKAGDAYFKQGLGDDYDSAANMYAKANNMTQTKKCYLARVCRQLTPPTSSRGLSAGSRACNS